MNAFSSTPPLSLAHHERHTHQDAILFHFTVLDANFLLRHPGAFDVLDRLGGFFDSNLDGFFETLFRRRFQLNDFRYGHLLSPD